jgi:predicted glutamine amidotransferase
MCRFLMVKGEENFSIEEFLFSFSQKCKENKEWQGDGWGICWLNSKNEWECFKSLSPIWEDKRKFKEFPKSKIFIIHARSSTFEKDKGNLNFNQPFVDGEITFVFNGEISGVRGIEVEGEIGAQKIFNLIKRFLSKMEIKEAIRKTQILIEKNSREIKALNIGICDKRNFFVLCRYSRQKDYYEIKYFKNSKNSLVCSEKILNLDFKTMGNGEILVL